jgi:hypothetical protein
VHDLVRHWLLWTIAGGVPQSLGIMGEAQPWFGAACMGLARGDAMRQLLNQMSAGWVAGDGASWLSEFAGSSYEATS